MSYSIDRSSRTRGVGAVAARDLRGDDGGGAVVRTGRGPVVITSRHEGLGAYSMKNPYGPMRGPMFFNKKLADSWERAEASRRGPRKAPKRSSSGGGLFGGVKLPPKIPFKAPAPRPGFVWVQTGKFAGQGHWQRAKAGGKKALFTPGRAAAWAGATSAPVGPAVPGLPATTSHPGGGGGGGGGSWGGGGGGGGSWGGGDGASRDEFATASEAEIREQEAALEAQQAADRGDATPDAGPEAGPGGEAAAPGSPGAAKKPMSTGMKVGIAAAAGWALFSMWKGH